MSPRPLSRLIFLLLLVVSFLCCVSLSLGYVTISDRQGDSFTFVQATPSATFPRFSIPAATAVNFTILVSSDVAFVNIHVAIPGQTTFNSSYNYVARLNSTNSLPFGTDTVTASQFVAGTTVFFTVGWQNGSAAVDTPFLFLFAAVSTSSSSTGGNRGGAVGDPQFNGFLGQAYQVHGVAQQVYSLISDALLQVNAMFVFLTKGACPPASAQLPYKTACWSHPGSYLGRITLQTIAGDTIDIQAGTAAEGFKAVLANGQQLRLGEEWKGNEVSHVSHPQAHHLSRAHCSLVHSHIVQCHVGLYHLTIANSDLFVNLHEVSVSDWTALTHEVQSHGLLGQTWRRRRGGEVDGIEGMVDDYAEQENDMLGTKTHFNRHRTAASQSD